MVNLEFPISAGRPGLRYRVYSGMSVRLFYHLVASRILGCEDNHICMFVDDYEFKHLGLITDRFYPDFPDVPTPYLFNECIVRVEFVADAGGEDPITANATGIETTMIADSKATASLPQPSSSRRFHPVFNRKHKARMIRRLSRWKYVDVFGIDGIFPIRSRP